MQEKTQHQCTYLNLFPTFASIVTFWSLIYSEYTYLIFNTFELWI